MRTHRMIPAMLVLLTATTRPAAAQQRDLPPPEETEVWRPVPPVVTPGPATTTAPPSDAIVLFDGTGLTEWVNARDGSPAGWTVADGVMTVHKPSGNIRTKRSFGSYQLHLEWRVPEGVTGEGQGRGNSGVFLASTGEGDLGYEVQILDSYRNDTYVNGMAGSVYKQAVPLANPTRPPGEWNVYDIIWTAPTFDASGAVRTPARVTVLFNGVLVQNDFELKGPTVYRGQPQYRAHGETPIKLQAHGDPSPPISFRNIWVRPLPAAAAQATSGNPILPGWYADPEAHVFDGKYWIFPTYSAPYDEQTFMDAFSSSDLVTWTKHERVLERANVSWARRAMWAPSIVQKDGWYYLFFGANDIQNDAERGGIGVARARSPAGPFEDWLGRPLIDRFHNGAQPIDQFVFRDDDGSHYIVYGGWRHCNIAKVNDDFTGFVPFPDGSTFREITPEGYVEGAFMLKKDGKYYFMWSEGGWTGPDYAVAYAIGDSPTGPFRRIGQILRQDASIATGAGHHSVLHAPGSDRWYIVYHRRPLGETDRNHRVVSIDELRFDADGRIRPVVMTFTGVAADPIR